MHVAIGTTQDAIVAFRTARDKTLKMPMLILTSCQVNMRAGLLPSTGENGESYLKIPISTR